MSECVREIIVDSFAGGGGASTGIELALERMGVEHPFVDIAVNHSGSALAMHLANHPHAVHMESDIWTVDPLATTQRRPVGLMWASPDCRHFSRAKGSTPVSKKVRGLAWSIGNWAEQVRPRIILLENVPEFQTWGPVITNAKGDEVPDPARAGETFRQWIGRFKRLGYRVEWRVLHACDFGAPTIRKRLFIAMRRDGQPIVWPKPTHGAPTSAAVLAGRLKPWRTASEVIDWTRPCPSIFMTREEAKAYTGTTGTRVNRPLADNTMTRVAAGVLRFVVERGEPFIVSYYGESGGRNDRSNSVHEPLRTITTEPRHGLVTPTLAPYMTAHYGKDIGSPADAPMRTVTGIPKVEPVTCSLAQPPLTEEQLAGARRVADFLRAHGWQGGEFVTVGDKIVVDIGMRMLTPRELARAQGFPEDYVLAAPFGKGLLSEAEQRHKIGNSVCPPVAAALVEANYRPQRRAIELPEQTWLFEEAA